MASCKKHLITLALISLVYTWFFVFKVVNNDPSVNFLGANSNITVFTQPESGTKPIVDVINSAQKEVIVVVYLISDKQIIKALGEARQRGMA